tara:strand:- start:37092 stop:37922 length:831 start_codon:yes stop_codon:yes gene_type:complete
MKSILITGGSGFFGTGFIKKLLNTEVERICVFSRGEHRQAVMRAELGDNPKLRWFIGDVRDRDRLRRAMSGVDVVVHAAALKRIEIGFYNPIEMVSTNIGGAINVVEASRDAGVKKVVALSTDKAWQPVSPYGQSKALAESIFRAANDGYGPKYSICRYGNVAGSSGSIIPTWREILKTKTTVPVTNPGCTRFWMTLPQAIKLVMDTIKTMKGGEIVIPDLPAYHVGDLAKAMGADMRVIGLPDFEKRHEGMGPNNTSDMARRMTIKELQDALKQV